MVIAPSVMSAIVAAVGGLLVGSFFNVVIWRLPRGESLIRPASHCPGCATAVRPYDQHSRGQLDLAPRKVSDMRGANLRSLPSGRAPHGAPGNCRGNLQAHSARHRAGRDSSCSTLVPVALIDLDHRIIPNVVLAPAAIAAVIVGGITHPSGIPEQLIAGAAAALFLFVFALAYPKGMGMGRRQDGWRARPVSRPERRRCHSGCSHSGRPRRDRDSSSSEAALRDARWPFLLARSSPRAPWWPSGGAPTSCTGTCIQASERPEGLCVRYGRPTAVHTSPWPLG